MKTAEQWYSEGGLNNDAAEIQHRRQIQIDALRHAKDMLDESQTETPVSVLAELIRGLELK